MERRRSLRAVLLALICDTGVLYASIVRGDANHARCAELLVNGEEELIVPSPVIVELDWLAGARGVPRVRDAVLHDVAGGALTVADLTLQDYTRVRELCARYSDLPLGLVDAAVIAIVERLNERKVATLDHRHFSIVRPRHVGALELLPR